MDDRRLRAWLAAVGLAAALAGCAGGTSSSTGRPSGGVEVFGTVDAGVGRTR